ncbi:MAG: CheR family methyltransferase [Alphaproteobacteria bacterium]|jgi:chemotaxis protein methyltransferase CheR
MSGKVELAAGDTCDLGAAADRLLAALRHRYGLKHDDLLERKALGVLRQRRAEGLDEWLDDLLSRPVDDPAWLGVVDAVTIHETYFFRDPGQLHVLRQTLLPSLIAERIAAGNRRLCLWSAGCASGEEAYSLAVLVLQALEEAGESHVIWSIEILGTDISPAMIDIARRAIYGGPGLDAFRQLPEGHDGYFCDLADRPSRRSVVPAVQELPRFQQHNLMDPEPPVTNADIVLCRNVFIYFDDASQRQAVSVLASAMGEGGYLLLGVTDRLYGDSGFSREATGTAVIYRCSGAGI